MARLPTTIDRVTQGAKFVSQGATRQSVSSTATLINNASAIGGQAVEVAAEVKVRRAAEDAIKRSQEDTQGGVNANSARDTAESTADADEDEFDIQQRGDVAAGKAFDATVKGLSEQGLLTQSTSDPMLNQEFAEIGKLFSASTQGRISGNVFNTRLASRVTNLRTRFPHKQREINKYITGRMGFDPVKRELARQAKLDSAQIEIQTDQIKYINNRVNEDPRLAGLNFEDTTRNVRQRDAQLAGYEDRKRQIEVTKDNKELNTLHQDKQASDILVDTGNLAASNMVGVLKKAADEGKLTPQLVAEKNQEMVQLVAKERNNYIQEMTKAGVTDRDTVNKSLAAFDNRYKGFMSLFKDKDLNSTFESANKAILTGDVTAAMTGPNGDFMRRLAVISKLGGAQALPFMTNILIEASSTNPASLIPRISSDGTIEPAKVKASNDDIKATVEVVPVKGDDAEERGLRPSFVSAAKTISSTPNVEPKVTAALVTNLSLRHDNVIRDKAMQSEVANAMTTPTALKNIKASNSTPESLKSLTSIVSGHMVTMVDKLNGVSGLDAQPQFSINKAGKLALTFKPRDALDLPLSGERKQTELRAQERAKRALQPAMDEYNRVSDGYVSLKELQGEKKDEVQLGLRAILSGVFNKQTRTPLNESDDISLAPDDEGRAQLPDTVTVDNIFNTNDAAAQFDSVMNKGSTTSKELLGQGETLRKEIQADLTEVRGQIVDDVADTILKNEGGFVDDPADKGGTTNFGITQKTMSTFLGRKATKDDMKNMNKATAKKIIVSEFIEKPGIDKTPTPVQPVLGDTSVLFGPARAIKFLQKAVNTHRDDGKIKVDGHIGPGTLKALEGINPELLKRSIVDQRIDHHFNVVDKDPSQKKFLRGWINRAVSFR